MGDAQWMDFLIAAGVLIATACTLIPRRRIAQSMGFLVLGALVTLLWLQLGSVDVALAEAALGGGLLGAILVCLSAPQHDRSTPAHDVVPSAGISPWLRSAAGVGVGAVLSVVICAAWFRVEQTMPDWEDPLDQQLPSTGVDHGVTGVLLAFRAYDTLLESAVLMVTAFAALALGASQHLRAPETATHPPDSLRWMVHLSAPVLLLAALWILFAGSTDSGGAFQSGAVLAALLILMRVAGIGLGLVHRLVPVLLVAGVLAFIAAGLLGPITGEPWLWWDPAWAFAAILTIEVLLTAGIAVGLYVIFCALLPVKHRELAA